MAKVRIIHISDAHGQHTGLKQTAGLLKSRDGFSASCDCFGCRAVAVPHSPADLICRSIGTATGTLLRSG
jgi:hypothetical protein